MKDRIKSILNPLLDLIYPDLCIACDVESPVRNACFCIDCLSTLPFTSFHEERENRVEKFFWGRQEIEKGTALFFFHKGELVQDMIHRLKYKNKAHIGDALGLHYGESLNTSQFMEDIDLIIPIPIHRSKRKKRSYNQSELIAKGISTKCGIPYSEKNLVKYSKTPSQTEMSRAERLENLKNTFKLADASSLSGKHVLIVDDILTTGATIEAAASLLSKHNAKVSVAVLAVGQY